MMAALCVVIGGNLSEERFSPEPPSKDFYTNFSPIGCISREKKNSQLNSDMHPMGLKLNTKVLGREFEGGPFFKRVSLNNSRKSSHHIAIIKRGD